MLSTLLKNQYILFFKVSPYFFVVPFKLDPVTLKLIVLNKSSHRSFLICNKIILFIGKLHLVLATLHFIHRLTNEEVGAITKFMNTKFIAIVCICASISSTLADKKEAVKRLLNSLIDYEKRYNCSKFQIKVCLLRINA